MKLVGDDAFHRPENFTEKPSICKKLRGGHFPPSAREVAKPQVLTEGEIIFTYNKRFFSPPVIFSK